MTMRRFCVIVLLIAWALCALAVERSSTIVYINGTKYYIHTVQPGETLYALAKAYGVEERTIVEHNPSAAAALKAAENIKIPVAADPAGSKVETQPERKLRKTFDSHHVAKGETLYSISRTYEIPINTIIADNPELDPIHLKPGQRILIRRKQIGSEDEAGTQAQWEEYRQTLNSVTEDDGFAYHIVHPGETFYSLARRFGITEEELGQLNGGLQAADLKAGSMIKVPGAATDRLAQRPDSLDAMPETHLADRRIEEVEFRALRRSETLDIALLLPMAVNGDTNANYLEFYQGFLLGLDSVKTKYGYSVNLNLYNTARDSVRVRQIVESDEFAGTDLIVGPVYEEELYPVLRFAEDKGIPVVSPLAHIVRMNSDALFQLAPDPACKYEKLKELVNPNKRITLICTQHSDREFEQEMLALIGDAEYTRHTYRYEHPSVAKANSPSDLTPLLDNGEDNLFVILADNEIDVDRILAAIASANTSLTSRGRTAPRFTVMGNARWNRYNNIDRTMFFKDRLVFVSTYHAKRDSERVETFDQAYIRAFGALPTLYAYRGYDTAAIFAPAMYNDIEYDMEGRRYTPLQTSYVFGQGEDRLNHVNRNWTRVNYNSDFTITIE